MNYEELEQWLNGNPDKEKVYNKLQDCKSEREKLKNKSNALGRKNSDIGYKKWTEKRSMSTGNEQTQLLLNATEQEPLKKRIKELDKMIKLLTDYKPPKQLTLLGEQKMSIEKLNKQYANINEGFFPPSYEVLGTIIKDNNAYNILGPDNNKMLDKDYPTLKRLLQDLASNM